MAADCDVRNVKLMVNYGIESLKFNQSVIVNSRVRLRARMEAIKDLRGIYRTHMKATMEVEGVISLRSKLLSYFFII
jgi:acyl dehydratase